MFFVGGAKENCLKGAGWCTGSFPIWGIERNIILKLWELKELRGTRQGRRPIPKTVVLSEGPKGGRRKGGRGRKLSHFSFCRAFRCCVVYSPCFPVWGEEKVMTIYDAGPLDAGPLCGLLMLSLPQGERAFARKYSAMEAIPALPWKCQSPFLSRPSKLSITQRDARGASEVRAELPQCIFTVWYPGRPGMLGMD